MAYSPEMLIGVAMTLIGIQVADWLGLLPDYRPRSERADSDPWASDTRGIVLFLLTVALLLVGRILLA